MDRFSPGSVQIRFNFMIRIEYPSKRDAIAYLFWHGSSSPNQRGRFAGRHR